VLLLQASGYLAGDVMDAQVGKVAARQRGFESRLVARFGPAVVKRMFDFILCIFAMPTLLLVGLPIVLLIMLDGVGPLYAQRRVGCSGREFFCLKFRTMAVDADRRLIELFESDTRLRDEWKETFKLKNDPRVTWIGGFLRKTSLDELPQILNVLRGEMSLVGPRPITKDELPLYGAAAAGYLSCRPGITGLWQISGRNNVSYAARIALDTKYIETWSPLLDLDILLRTIPAVVTRKGAY